MSLPDFGPRYRVQRQLDGTILGAAYAATADDGTSRTLVVLAPVLEELLPERGRALDVLRGLADDRARLDAHPALVTVDDAGETAEGRLWVAHAPVDAPPAGDRLRSGRTLPSADVRAHALVLGDALGALHAQGLRHGAIAPGLVHLAPSGARLVGPGLLDALVAAGAPARAALHALDAAAYAAPEASIPMAGARADVYATGTTLYALLTGRPPFGGRTTALTMAAVLADLPGTGEGPQATVSRPTPVDSVDAERVTTALLRAIEKAPDDRWATMRQFTDAVAGRTPTPSAMPVAVPDARGIAARPLVLLAVGSVVVLVAAIVLLF